MAFVGGITAGSALIAGSSLASGALGYFGSQSAASKQMQAQEQALDLQRRMFKKTLEYEKPYLNTGGNAAYTLGSLYGFPDAKGQTHPVDYSQFTKSPDYQFALQQGQLGLDRYENAKGLALSGGALKDVAQFNQGLATQQFGNYYNRLLSLSQLGNNAANALGGSAANFSGQMSNSMVGAGQAAASGIVGGVNAITGGINSGITNSLLYNAINRSSYANTSIPNNGSGIYTGDPLTPGFG